MKTKTFQFGWRVATALTVCLATSMQLQGAEQADSVGSYRLIFNCDGYSVAKDSKGDHVAKRHCNLGRSNLRRS